MTTAVASKSWFLGSQAGKLAQYEAGRTFSWEPENRPVTGFIDFLRLQLTSIALSTITLPAIWKPDDVVCLKADGGIRKQAPHYGTVDAYGDVEHVGVKTDVPVYDAHLRHGLAPTTQDLASRLKQAGLSISGIAEIVGVQRKTVYSWLNDAAIADAHNHDRLAAVVDVFGAEPVGSLRFLTRHWERQLPNGRGTLKGILTSPNMEVSLAQEALNLIRPAIARSMKQDTSLSSGVANLPPAALLSDYLQAVTE